MQDYEAMAAKLANALRDMLKVGAFHKSRTDARITARAVLWDFDNGIGVRVDEERPTVPYRDAAAENEAIEQLQIARIERDRSRR